MGYSHVHYPQQFGQLKLLGLSIFVRNLLSIYNSIPFRKSNHMDDVLIQDDQGNFEVGEMRDDILEYFIGSEYALSLKRKLIRT